MNAIDGLLIIGVIACWCITVPMIAKNWRDVRKHRKPCQRAAEAGFHQWDYSDCTKEPKWCAETESRWKPEYCTSTWDRVVLDTGMLIGITVLCGAVVYLT